MQLWGYYTPNQKLACSDYFKMIRKLFKNYMHHVANCTRPWPVAILHLNVPGSTSSTRYWEEVAVIGLLQYNHC